MPGNPRPEPLSLPAPDEDGELVSRPFHEALAALIAALGLTGWEAAELLREKDPHAFPKVRNTTISRWCSGPEGTWGQVPPAPRQRAAHTVLLRAWKVQQRNARRREESRRKRQEAAS